MSNGNIVIRKKFISWAVSIGAGLAAILIGYFTLSDRMNANAESTFQQRFNKIYPIAHASCSATVSQLSENQRAIMNILGNLKLSMKIITMAKRQEMSWQQRQMIVNELVTHDSIPYDSAYALLGMGHR